MIAAAALVVETAMTVAGTGTAVALPDNVASTSALKSEAAKYGAAEAQDATSALLMARLQNRKIEILSERTPDSTTYALPDGSMQTAAYAGPIRVKQDGDWHDIDTDLSDTGPALEPRVAAADISVSDGGDTALASVTKSGRSFGLGWEDKLPTPTVRDATASYALGAGQTLTATALAQGFSENIALAARPADQSLTYRIPLNLKGLTLSRADSGHLLLKDSTGKLVAEAPAPMMWDASKDPASGESAHQEQVAARVETAADGTQTLVLTPDQTFLATATYPVTVDPTTTLAVTTDTWIQTPDYLDSQVSSQELKSGTYDGGTDLARSFLKFDVSKFAGKHITDTNLALYNYYSATCATDGSGTTVRRITTDWSSTSVTWATRPSSTGTGAVNNLVPRGYSSACPAGWSTWDIDSIVQAWADGTPNYGLMVYGTNETDSKTWRRFRSANYTTTGYAPKLTVTYNSYPAKPTSAGVSPSAVNAYSGKQYVTTYTPTLSAKVSDPDGSTVKAQFEITNDPAYSGETSYSYTATSASVPSGSTATLAVPSANQLAASHLRMRVRGYDGTDYGAWSSYIYFVPNVAKPNPSTISCSPYSSGSWTDQSSSGATCTLSTSSTDGAGYQWGLDDKTLPNHALDTSDGNGGDSQTITIKPGNGWHTLYARTIDSGGNLSASATSYAFGVGKAGLTSPVTGDTTDDDVSLSATQSGAFTGVTYQYRIGDSVGWQPIPVTYVTKSDGSAISSWPVSFSSSANPGDLTWAATGQLADDGPVQVRALFTDGTNTYGTDAATVTVDRKADNAPVSAIGPGTVNLLTGDFSLDATDVGAFGARGDPYVLLPRPDGRGGTARPGRRLRPQLGLRRHRVDVQLDVHPPDHAHLGGGDGLKWRPDRFHPQRGPRLDTRAGCREPHSDPRRRHVHAEGFRRQRHHLRQGAGRDTDVADEDLVHGERLLREHHDRTLTGGQSLRRQGPRRAAVRRRAHECGQCGDLRGPALHGLLQGPGIRLRLRYHRDLLHTRQLRGAGPGDQAVGHRPRRLGRDLDTRRAVHVRLLGPPPGSLGPAPEHPAEDRVHLRQQGPGGHRDRPRRPALDLRLRQGRQQR
ncbi:DNRLRE domain-containing protein [Streptomyces sp. NBC_01390]|uniref:DNRLRE domain-containing protein n=1 Tax=Streptomyces sp. NBC_01390 TaxID=2903850 RepID=UPI00324DE3BE